MDSWDNINIGLVNEDDITADNYINPDLITTVNRQQYNDQLLQQQKLDHNQWLYVSRNFLDNNISGQKFDTMGPVIDLLFAKPLKDLPNWTYKLHLAEGPDDYTEALIYNRQDRNDEIIIAPVPLDRAQRFMHIARYGNTHILDHYIRYSMNVDGTDILFFWIKKDF